MSQRIAERNKRVDVLTSSRRDGAAVDYYEGPACRTRNRKMRKLGPIDDVDVVSPVQLEEMIGAADSEMPEKPVLELVLDILQRRDTYELFGEPMKDEEVKPYYEKVKEAMDFGTMRAKLHEQMYTKLDQFEHDVFLITENAMHFNAKSTIFFRQARTIHELAKRVFHQLRSDPEGFESRLSKTRQAIGRSERWTTKIRECRSRRIAAACSAAHQAVRFHSSGLASSVSPSEKRRRRVRKDVSGRIDVHTRNHKRPNSLDPDHRSSYKPWTDFLDDRGSVLTTFCNELQPTVQVRQYDIGYRESLMMFCKDFGPTAHKVALRKLQALQSAEAPSLSCNPIAVPNLSSEPPSCSCRIPEEPFSCRPCQCPSTSEQPMAIVPVPIPPFPDDVPSRLIVLGLTNAKASSLNRNTREKPSLVAAPKGGLGAGVRARTRTRTDPRPLTVDLYTGIHLNQSAMVTFDPWSQHNVFSPGLADFPTGRSSDQGIRQEKLAVIAADTRSFSFDLPYLKAKLE